MQVAISSFCMFQSDSVHAELTNTHDSFHEDGEQDEDTYTKQSIYAVLYSLYEILGTQTSELGVEYQFTFNTWGISPDKDMRLSQWKDNDPQRHGRAAYGGLVTQPKVMAYLEGLGRPAKILEVGCGTGAGANEITKVHPTAEVTALDMQAAAIETCNKLHAAGNPHLTCVHGNGMETGFPSETYDIIVVSETHIAAVSLDPETKLILKEIERMLAPGGFFVWGNALPTRVWVAAEQYFKSDETALELTEFRNVTTHAVNARVEDGPRVDAYCNSMFDHLIATYYMPQCRHVLDRMVKNFYRHPGTNLFKTMVTGYDSYVHMSAQKPLK